MDNGNSKEITLVYNYFKSIFNLYELIHHYPDEWKLLGMLWIKSTDNISCVKLFLDTKGSAERKIVSSIASNYDLFNFNLPK